MTTPVLLGLVVLGVVVLVVVGAWAFRRRAIEQERRRVAALTSLETRLREVTGSLDDSVGVAEPLPRRPAPLHVIEPGGRAAFIDALAEAVARARADGSRLTAALVESRSASSATLAGEIAAVTGVDAYEVGAHAVALVVPGAGRADTLGLLARVEAACGATGNAAELEPGEDALALATRLLAARDERVSD